MNINKEREKDTHRIGEEGGIQRKKGGEKRKGGGRGWTGEGGSLECLLTSQNFTVPPKPTVTSVHSMEINFFPISKA